MDCNILTLPIRRFEDGGFQPHQDLVTVEEPLQILLGDRDLAITMRTPGHDNDLVAGFLLSEGLIRRPEDIVSVVPGDRGTIRVNLVTEAEIDETRFARNFYVSSSCGVCGKASIEGLKMLGCAKLPHEAPRVSPALISSLPDKMRAAQRAFDHTGGLHAAALFDAASGDLILLREDVGRHNALDKVIGAALSRRLLPLDRSVLALSGRVSFELVQKALMAGIPVVAAVGAPSSLAVETARRFGMTLIGFMREQRFNVYSTAGRLE